MHIDDPEAMNSKKKLNEGNTPLQALNMIRQKIKNISITENCSERKNPKTMTTLLYTFNVELQSIGVVGKAEDTSKKSAE